MKTLVLTLTAVVAATTLTGCGFYDDPSPTYVCPAYGNPGQPGYHPAQPPVRVQPKRQAPAVKPPSQPKTPPRVPVRK